jgi:hypothetical protein
MGIMHLGHSPDPTGISQGIVNCNNWE